MFHITLEQVARFTIGAVSGFVPTYILAENAGEEFKGRNIGVISFMGMIIGANICHILMKTVIPDQK